MNFALICLLLCAGFVQAAARTDSIPRSFLPGYFTVQRSGLWEESHTIRSLPPSRIVGLRIHYKSQVAGLDTIYVTTTSRLIPLAPLSEHWRRSILATVIVNVAQDTQTIDIDLRSQNIRLFGYEGLTLSHVTVDADRIWSTRIAPYLNTELDPETFSTTVGRSTATPKVIPIAQKFCLQVFVEHDYEIPATRVRPQSGSMFAEYNSIAAWEYGSNNASIVDLDADGFDDVMFDSLLTMNRSAGVLDLRTVFVEPTNSRFGADISAWADFDRDGDQDCIIHDHVTKALRLLRTDTTEHFTDVTAASGISGSGETTVLLWFDADNDGDADIFVGRAAQDMLWLNNGAGVFTNATVTSGLADAEPAPFDVCGGASLGDINADGFTDIMVVTRGNAPDRLMVNMGGGKFTSISSPGRIGSVVAGSHGNGEGAEWGDFNGDGIDDILVANSLRVDDPDPLQDGSIVWRTKSRTALLFDTLWSDLGLPFVGSTNGYTSADINLDGLPDFASVVPDTQLVISDRAYVSILLQKAGPGRRAYTREAFSFGLPITDVGFALRTDIDMDGDPDFIVNRTSVLRNNISNTNNGITIRLRNDSRPLVTKDCFGTALAVHAGSTVQRSFFPGSISTSRGSVSSAALNYGLGTQTNVDSIVVTYSDKFKHTFKDIPANGAYILTTSGSILRIASPPRQQQPYFNEADVSPTPHFEWSSMGTGVTYDLQIAKDSNFLNVLRNVNAITTPSHDLVSALPTAQEYQWRIRAHFANGSVSPWSTKWPLTVGKVIPGGLRLLAPQDQSTMYVPEVVLRWSHQNDSRQINALTQYRIQLSFLEDFATVEKELLVDELLRMDVGGLQQSKKYFWRVQPIQSGVDGIWSSVWSFSSASFPGPIELLTPPNGQKDVDAITWLTWKRPTGLDSRAQGTYVLHFGLDSLCTDILDTGTASDTVRRAQYLLLDQRYFWRVRLVTPFGFGPWSDIWSFTTGLVLDVNDEVSAGPRSTQASVFPMPFSDRLTVRLPVCNTAHIKVHDLNGMLLYASDVLEASSREYVDVNTLHWPSGPVVVTVVADGGIQRVMAIHHP